MISNHSTRGVVYSMYKLNTVEPKTGLCGTPKGRSLDKRVSRRNSNTCFV